MALGIRQTPTPGWGRPYDVFYVGRKAQRGLAIALLGLDGDVEATRIVADRPLRAGYVCEAQIPGAMHVPYYLNAVVPLGQSLEDVLARYDSELRRRLRKQRQHFRLRQVLESAEIDRANREMLQPYAAARRGDGAVHLMADAVRGNALKFGRLGLVYLGDEEVACHLGSAIIRSGIRYWTTIRFGYPEAVFSDAERLRDTNSMTTYLALEWALENGFDYYNIGGCLGRPDDGLLQWKRRRGGEVDTMGDPGVFHVRLPREGAANFLWDSPLFALERGCLTLQLGLPKGPSDEDVLMRYREMGVGGLSKVYLHCARPPGEHLLESLRRLYKHQKLPPMVVSVPSA